MRGYELSGHKGAVASKAEHLQWHNFRCGYQKHGRKDQDTREQKYTDLQIGPKERPKDNMLANDYPIETHAFDNHHLLPANRYVTAPLRRRDLPALRLLLLLAAAWEWEAIPLQEIFVADGIRVCYIIDSEIIIVFHAAGSPRDIDIVHVNLTPGCKYP
eukprot:6194218-Pleurochrysis_carterae.AAC.3